MSLFTSTMWWRFHSDRANLDKVTSPCGCRTYFNQQSPQKTKENGLAMFHRLNTYKSPHSMNIFIAPLIMFLAIPYSISFILVFILFAKVLLWFGHSRQLVVALEMRLNYSKEKKIRPNKCENVNEFDEWKIRSFEEMICSGMECFMLWNKTYLQTSTYSGRPEPLFYPRQKKRSRTTDICKQTNKNQWKIFAAQRNAFYLLK